MTRRTGGIAGIASGLVTLLAVVGVVAAGGDQRANVVPSAMAVALALMLGCLLGLRDAHRHRPQAVLTAGFRLTFAGLAGTAGFYATLVASSVAPAGFPFENDAIAALGVLLGSLIVMVVLPAGLLLLGAGFLKARVLPKWARPLPLVLLLSLAGGAAGVALTQNDTTIVGVMVALLGAAWALLGAALLRPNRGKAETQGS